MVPPWIELRGGRFLPFSLAVSVSIHAARADLLDRRSLQLLRVGHDGGNAGHERLDCCYNVGIQTGIREFGFGSGTPGSQNGSELAETSIRGLLDSCSQWAIGGHQAGDGLDRTGSGFNLGNCGDSALEERCEEVAHILE
jgi:hypothetical protein